MKRTILVTGGAGHVGSHLIELLLEDPRNQILSLDNYFVGRESNHIDPQQVKRERGLAEVGSVEYRHGHTKEIDRLVRVVPQIVYHLGEYARIATSFADVAQVYDMNIAGTFAVVEFCRRHRTKLVYAGSSTRFDVSGVGRNQSPYSFTKSMNVDLMNNYSRWYPEEFRHAICYFYNAFGPRELGEGHYATLIAKFAALRRQGKPLPVVRPGTQRRAFTYVKDLARGIALVGEKGEGDGYALGNEKTYSVLEIAEAFGGPIELIDGSPGREGSENDTSKARALGWTTTVQAMDYISELGRS